LVFTWAYLEEIEVTINEVAHRAYFWIRIHTSVEADHFAFAVKGANQALRYFSGPESAARVKDWIIKGFREFAGVQARFMDGLLKD
jgi:hypothetical protein